MLHVPVLKCSLEVGFVPSQDRGGHVSVLSGLAVSKGLAAEEKQQPLIQRGGMRQVSSRLLPEELSSTKQFFWPRQTQGIPALPSRSPFSSKAQHDLEFSLAFGSFYLKFKTAMGCVPFLLAPGSRAKAVQTFQT